MEKEQLTKLIQDVFQPRPDEKVLFLTDLPNNHIKDNPAWVKRRKMAAEWLKIFSPLVNQTTLLSFPATGKHNSDIPTDILYQAKNFNIVIAMTEYSASAPLKSLNKIQPAITRVASMPGVDKKMEKTAFLADYSQVKKYALALKELLSRSDSADIKFNTGDSLHIDLRFRQAEADKGECIQAGQFINFPSGEAFIVPYEGSKEEALIHGPSQTEGIWPIMYNKQILQFTVKANQITQITGPEPAKSEAEKLFHEDPTRRNIAELGIGCNPRAIVSGNVLEDEKVGLHIAYGTSSHFTGGTVTSDRHEDIVYAKGCPIEGTTVTLNHSDSTTTTIIKNTELQYNLFD